MSYKILDLRLDTLETTPTPFLGDIRISFVGFRVSPEFHQQLADLFTETVELGEVDLERILFRELELVNHGIVLRLEHGTLCTRNHHLTVEVGVVFDGLFLSFLCKLVDLEQSIDISLQFFIPRLTGQVETIPQNACNHGHTLRGERHCW
jgi:hypothetical protein